MGKPIDFGRARPEHGFGRLQIQFPCRSNRGIVVARFKGDVYEWVGLGVMSLLKFLSRGLGWYSVRDRNLPFAIGSSLGHIWWILGLFSSSSRRRLSGTRHNNEGRRKEGRKEKKVAMKSECGLGERFLGGGGVGGKGEGQ